jgi:hypothetical protein
MAEAARALMLPREAGEPVDLPGQAGWLAERLDRRRPELEELFAGTGADPLAITQAVDSLSRLVGEWPCDVEDHYDHVVFGPQTG